MPDVISIKSSHQRKDYTLRAPNMGEYMSRMKRFWEAFINKELVPRKELRPDILNSWQRSLNYDVSPEESSPPSLSEEQIRQRLRMHRECMEAMEPVVASVLDLIEYSNYLVAFVDSDGFVLKVYGNKDILKMLSNLNFRVGANWSEKYAGTTAIGITLGTKQPSHVFHAEHYCRKLHEFACTAVPILDPFTKDLMGVLDFVAFVEDHEPHAMGMALQMAKCIELEIYRSRKERDEFFREYSTQLMFDQMERGIILLDEQRRIRRSNLKALDYLGLESRDLLHRKLGDLDILSSWHDLNKPFFISLKGGSEIRLAHQPIVCKQKVIGSLILVEKGNAGRAMPVIRESGFPIGNSPAFMKVLEYADNASRFDSNILIQGETGTGKEVIARYIHERSRRKEKPFLAINCGCIPKELLGSELFGYEEGAFTGARKKGKLSKFEMANGGTLLFDEISEMPHESQVYLLRVIEERAVTRLGGNKAIPVDIRIIAASNKDLQQEVDAGRFRADLFFRLNVLRIDLPSLKERKEDIPLLAQHFIDALSETLEKPVEGLSEESILALKEYDWPGNIRELRNCIEQAIIMCKGKVIQPHDLPEYIRKNPVRREDFQNDKDKEQYIRFMEAYEQSRGNITKIAKMLNVSRPTVYAWKKKYGVG